jgi:diguanylate cyclase
VEIMIEQEDGPAQFVGTRGPGSLVGEMAIVDHAPRTATVRAVELCSVLEISREDFARRLSESDPVVRMTTQVILTRYRDMLSRADIRAHSRALMETEALERSYTAQSDALETVKLANEFGQSLRRGEVHLHYQPIVDLRTRKAAGFEALMRWAHPLRGSVSPALFIPIIEDSGQIVEASQWALGESLAALKRIEARSGLSDLFMSVNFSSRDFASDDFVGGLYTALSRSDIAPARVHLEITERLLMGQPDNARETLRQCRKAGMSISIDDFGTGYSSLSYLHSFPIDTLKIDRSFVKDMADDENARELVRSIIMLGKNLKMHIIAEGVETAGQADMLMQMGCDMAQGYYFAKPMPEAALIDVLKK